MARSEALLVPSRVSPLGPFHLRYRVKRGQRWKPIQKQEAQAIGHTLMLAFVRRRGLQIAPMHGLQFGGLLPLSTPDQFT